MRQLMPGPGLSPALPLCHCHNVTVTALPLPMARSTPATTRYNPWFNPLLMAKTCSRHKITKKGYEMQGKMVDGRRGGIEIIDFIFCITTK